MWLENYVRSFRVSQKIHAFWKVFNNKPLFGHRRSCGEQNMQITKALENMHFRGVSNNICFYKKRKRWHKVGRRACRNCFISSLKLLLDAFAMSLWHLCLDESERQKTLEIKHKRARINTIGYIWCTIYCVFQEEWRAQLLNFEYDLVHRQLHLGNYIAAKTSRSTMVIRSATTEHVINKLNCFFITIFRYV